MVEPDDGAVGRTRPGPPPVAATDRSPSAIALVAASVLALGASLAADALLVRIAIAVWPSTKHYGHFQFSDYGALTVIGVVCACAMWPVICRLSHEPRRFFFRLAVVVTLVLWLPDLYLLVRHEPVHAVVILMLMHLAVALVTYNVIVRAAPPGPARATAVVSITPAGDLVDPSFGPETAASLQPAPTPPRATKRFASALGLLLIVDFLLGTALLFLISPGRRSGWLPHTGQAMYLAHAALGVPLALGACAYLLHVRSEGRNERLSGWIGLIGIAFAGLGGVLAVAHGLRFVGMACMLAGPVVAGFGFAIPALAGMSETATSPVPEAP